MIRSTRSLRQLRRLKRVAMRLRRHPVPLAEATVRLATVQLALRLLPFSLLLRLVAPPTACTSAPVGVDDDYLWAVNAIGRAMFGSRGCLRRALALCWYCRRREIPAELRIGVRRAAEGIEAHAWVEQGGEILIGGPASHVQRYAPLGSPTTIDLDLFDLAR